MQSPSCATEKKALPAAAHRLPAPLPPTRRSASATAVLCLLWLPGASAVQLRGIEAVGMLEAQNLARNVESVTRCTRPHRPTHTWRRYDIKRRALLYYICASLLQASYQQRAKRTEHGLSQPNAIKQTAYQV